MKTAKNHSLPLTHSSVALAISGGWGSSKNSFKILDSCCAQIPVKHTSKKMRGFLVRKSFMIFHDFKVFRCFEIWFLECRYYLPFWQPLPHNIPKRDRNTGLHLSMDLLRIMKFTWPPHPLMLPWIWKFLGLQNCDLCPTFNILKYFVLNFSICLIWHI